MKLGFPLIGAVIAVLALTSKEFAHHPAHQKVIAAALIVAVFSLIGLIAGRLRKPKPQAPPQRPVYPFSGTRR